MRQTVYTLSGDKVILDDNHHVATGGEGSVYIKGNKAYKIYLDPSKAIRAGMDEKWKLLANLRHANIISPIDALVNDRQQFIGLVFNLAKGDPLCMAFPNAWWTRQGFTHEKCGIVVKNMRELMTTAHQQGALMVDCNEMNWMLEDTNVQVLDTDSWQVGRFPATAIMPSIQDPHHTTFSEGTDWYSWAIVTFQLWTGIHPFRGGHPVHGKDWATRMKLNASVFDTNVRMPPATRALDDIPPNLRKWYQMTFSTTTRDTPPSSFDLVQGAVNRTVSNLRSLKLTPLFQATSDIKAVVNGVAIYRANSGYTAYDLLRNKALTLSDAQCQAILDRKAAITREGVVLHYLMLNEQSSEATLINLDKGLVGKLLTNARSVWQSQNRVFLYEPQGAALHEVTLTSTDVTVIGSVKRWSCYPQSSKFYRHAYLQSLCGKSVVGVLVDGGVIVAPAWDLDEYHVLQMAFVDTKNLWAVGQNKKTQNYEILRMEVSSTAAKIVEKFHTDTPSLNIGCAYPSASSAIGLIELESGLCMHRQDKQNLLTNETIGTLLTGLPFMAMIDRDRIYKVESVSK